MVDWISPTASYRRPAVVCLSHSRTDENEKGSCSRQWTAQPCVDSEQSATEYQTAGVSNVGSTRDFASGIFRKYRDELQAIINTRLSAGRSERIRTSDPVVPNDVRYQTALHSVTSGASIDQPPAFDKRLIAFFMTSFLPTARPSRQPLAPKGAELKNVTKKQLWQEIFVKPHTSPARRRQIC